MPNSDVRYTPKEQVRIWGWLQDKLNGKRRNRRKRFLRKQLAQSTKITTLKYNNNISKTGGVGVPERKRRKQKKRLDRLRTEELLEKLPQDRSYVGSQAIKRRRNQDRMDK